MERTTPLIGPIFNPKWISYAQKLIGSLKLLLGQVKTCSTVLLRARQLHIQIEQASLFKWGSGTTSSDAIVASIGAITADALGVGGATSKPTVANVASTGGGAATATLNADGTITMSGTPVAGNTVSLNINGTSHTLTVAADEYTLSGAGVAAQLSDEINALGLTGVSTSASGAVVSFNAGAAVERPVVTSSVSASGASGTITPSW
jgi:phage tail sheath gpL-like